MSKIDDPKIIDALFKGVEKVKRHDFEEVIHLREENADLKDKLARAIEALKACVETLGYQDAHEGTMTDIAYKKGLAALEGDEK